MEANETNLSCEIPEDDRLALPEPDPAYGFRDVENCFNLFFGHGPAGEVASLESHDDLLALLAEILNSDEFADAVLRPLLLREALPHESPDRPVPFALIDWVQRRLPIGDDTRHTSGAARTWGQLLELLLSDSIFVQVSSRIAEANVDAILRERVEKEEWSKVTRSVVGNVDEASAFQVRGWAADLCDKSMPALVELYADGAFIGSSVCGESRPDVQDYVGGSGNYGFTFSISASQRESFMGGSTLEVIDSLSREQIGGPVVVHYDAVRSWDLIAETRKEILELRRACERIEARLPDMGRMASVPIEAYAEYWERFYRLSPDTIAEQRARCHNFAYRPLVSIVLPTWKSDTRLLERAIASVREQTYDRWELIVTDDASESDELRFFRRRYKDDPRISWLDASERGGIALNTNRGIEVAHGEYVAFLDQDDELSREAMYQVAAALQTRRYGLIYSDEDRIEEDEFGRCVHHTPFFKPGFDPDLLLAHNYLCHLVVLRRDVLAAAGNLRPGFEGAQDHDLLLRVSEQVAEQDLYHVSRVLYHWRVNPDSMSNSAGREEAIRESIVAAVSDHLERRALPASVEIHDDPVGTPRPFSTRIRWSLGDNPPRVSVIVATRDGLDLLRPCVQSVLDSLTIYPGDAEVLIVDNDSVDPLTLEYLSNLSIFPNVRRLHFHGAFNWSAINNMAADEATGEILIFLNNDTIVLTKDWCAEMVANAMRPDVGAVGARLLYADGTVQHAGVVLGIEGVAGHECAGETPGAGGYFGRGHLLRSAAAVTAACMATKKAVFEQLDGGFDDLELKVAFNDVDYCMKVRRAGLRVVYNPFAVLYHLESKSRGREVSPAQKARHRAEAQAFRARWGDSEDLDPYYNRHFERFARPFERLRPPPDAFADLAPARQAK